MSLVEDYYELNEAEEVSSIWKVTQIIFYILSGCIGLWCGYTMALLRLKFGDKCYLFTKTKLLLYDSELYANNIVNWESDTLCDFCQYSMISSFIVATIWATFFLMCGKGGKSLTGLPQPWRIVWPSLIFNFLYFIIALSTAINIQHGTDYFCLRKNLDNKIHIKSFVDICSPLKAILPTDVHITSLQLEIVMKTSWGCAISWLILFLISFFRIVFVTDFNLFKICIFKISETSHSKKEEILKITNYEEPKKIHFDRSPLVEFEEILEENKGQEKVKENIEKKFIRQYFFKSSFIKPNATFYVSTDIRMLNRQKKKKSFKSIRESNKTFENIKFFEKNFEISKLPSFDYDIVFSKELYHNRKDDCFIVRQKSFTEKKDNRNKTRLYKKVTLDEFKHDNFKKFKKL